jgi:uncharacterized protein
MFSPTVGEVAMKCPACQTLLTIADRQGVEIDYCPSCRGVWLDRGELDKLLERARRDEDSHRELEDSDDRRPPASGYDRDSRHYPPQRKSFWSNVFDFD